MTAPATRPTPAILAQRKPRPPAAPSAPEPQARTLTVADAVRPGKLYKHELLRPFYERGLRASGMRPEARLVGLTLLGYANWRSGVLHTGFRPTAEELAEATGLTSGQALVQIEVLTSRGWLRERTIANGPKRGEPALQLCIPAMALEQLRDDRAQARADEAAQ